MAHLSRAVLRAGLVVLLARALSHCDRLTSCGVCVADPDCYWCPHGGGCSASNDIGCVICSCEKTCPTPPPPQECLNVTTGDNCDFYATCLEHYKHCQITEDVIQPKCKEYQEMEGSLSSEGHAWSTYVRHCLQRQIADKVLKPEGTSFSCQDVQDSFFRDHLPCYLTDGSVPGLPFGYCQLPLSDKARIIWHAKGIFFSRYIWEAFKSFVELQSRCEEVWYAFEAGPLPPLSPDGPFPLASVASVLNASVGKLGWVAYPALTAPLAQSAGNAVSCVLPFQVANYSGPSTPRPGTNMTAATAQKLLADAIHSASNGTYGLNSFNGAPPAMVV